MVINFLRVSNSWFASCSDKRLRCSRGKTGTAGNVLKTVCTKPLMSRSCHILKRVTVCVLSPQRGVELPGAADGSAPAEQQRSAQRAAAAHPGRLHD